MRSKTTLFKKLRLFFSLLSAAIILGQNGAVSALSQAQTDVFNSGVYYFDVGSSTKVFACGYSDVTSGVTGGGGSTTAPSDVQIQNAKIIIGVAKTDNLGQQGALIGLMVGITESNLTILANQSVPLSESNPAKEGDTSGQYNADSLGVFQQRASQSWSTFAPNGGSEANNNKDAVWQLMDPAYAAEAFFGSPPGSNAPDPLSKGLQNVSGWQSMQPWVAAQAVQHSGTADGLNYKQNLGVAQSLLNKYWDSSDPVSLPVPVNGGTGGGVAAQPGFCTSFGLASTTICTVNAPVYGSVNGSGKEYSQQQLAAIFGDPGTASNHSAMQSRMASVNFVGRQVSVNPVVAPCLQAVSDEIRQRGINYQINDVGCYRFDSDNGTSNIGLSSYHTYGAACDINSGTNPFQICPCNASYDMPPEIVQAFYDHGFTWGGNWLNRKDYMHFEFNGITPP